MVFWRKKKNTPGQEKSQETETEDEIICYQDGKAVDPLSIPAQVEDARENIDYLPHNENEEEGGWLSRLTSGLRKSSAKLGDVLTKRKLDEQALEELEEALIMADLGPKTAANIVQNFRMTRFGREVEENEIKQALSDNLAEILEPVAKPLVVDYSRKPYVILMTGVNGVGKTTTIGKLAGQFQNQGKKVMMAAADTFRAAAVDQIKIWGERNHCPVVAKEIGSDPAAVAFEALEQARAQQIDILLIDTAGRLHNKKNLMEELQKIIRVIRKKDETAPHSCLLVLDATTGQNAMSQVETFKQLVDISGLIVTKLDGSAKGGVVIAIADMFKLPIHAVGVGEGIDDLQPFTAESFANSLVGLDSAI